MLWKEAWLERVSVDAVLGNEGESSSFPRGQVSSWELIGSRVDQLRELSRLTKKPDGSPSCQATALPTASCPLDLGSGPTYVRNFLSNLLNSRADGRDVRILGRYLWGKLIIFVFMLWTRALWNRDRYRKTPSERLNLQAGEWAQVRSAWEILRTLDRKACNRGMEFKAEMFQFCGRKFRVIGRIVRRIDEHTGQVREFRNECILLDSVFCHGQRSFCARSNYHYWREIWLRRCE